MSNIIKKTTNKKPRPISLRAICKESLAGAIGIYIAAAAVIIERLTTKKLAYALYLLAGLFLDFRTDVTRKKMRTRSVIDVLKERIV